MINLKETEGWKEITTLANEITNILGRRIADRVVSNKSKQNKKLDKELLGQIVKYDEEIIYLKKIIGDDIKSKLGVDDVDDVDYARFIYNNF